MKMPNKYKIVSNVFRMNFDDFLKYRFKNLLNERLKDLNESILEKAKIQNLKPIGTEIELRVKMLCSEEE
jgi:hypothetical protein